MVDFGEREGRGIAYEDHMIIIHEILHIVIKGMGFLGLERYPWPQIENFVCQNKGLFKRFDLVIENPAYKMKINKVSSYKSTPFFVSTKDD